MENNILPKWLVNGLGGLLVIFVALLIIQQGYSFNQTVKNQKPANTISVSGDGQVTATPDLATINVGVQTNGATAQAVKDQNNTKVNAVIAFLKQQGVAPGDITTSQINVYPEQSYGIMTPGGVPTAPKITGYTGNQSLTIKVHNADKSTDLISKIQDGAVNAGANQVDGVYFSFEKATLENLQQQARQQAIDAAKQKAQGLASQAGLVLGKVTSISETNSGYPGPVPYGLNSAMALAPADKSVSANIQNGTQDITESMTVTFEVQ